MKISLAIAAGIVGAGTGFIGGGHVAYLLNLHALAYFLGLALAGAVLLAVVMVLVALRSYSLVNPRRQSLLFVPLAALAIGSAVVLLRLMGVA